MVLITKDMIKEFQALMEEIDEPLKKIFQIVYEGCAIMALVEYLEANDGNVSEAHKELVDDLKCPSQYGIDATLGEPTIPTDLNRGMGLRDSDLVGMSGYSKEEPTIPTDLNRGLGLRDSDLVGMSGYSKEKPTIPTDLYRGLGLRDSDLVGMSGYSKEGLTVIVVGAGLSTFDKAYVSSRMVMDEMVMDQMDAFDDGLCRNLPSHLKGRTLELQDQIVEFGRLNIQLHDIQRSLRGHSARRSQQFQLYRNIRYKKEQCSSLIDALKFEINTQIKKIPALKGWVCRSGEDIRAISTMNEELNLEKRLLGFYLEDTGGELTRAGVACGIEMKIMSPWGLAGTTSDGGSVAFITKEMESKWWEILRSRAMVEEGEGEEGNAALVDSAINYFPTNFDKYENLKGFLCREICHVRFLSGINSQFSKDFCCFLDLSRPNSENVRRKACMEGLELAEVVLEENGDDEGAEEHREEHIAFPNSLYFNDTYRHKKDRDDFDFGKLP